MKSVLKDSVDQRKQVKGHQFDVSGPALLGTCFNT